MGDAIRLVQPRSVTGDGEGLVSLGGLVWLGEVADRSGLTAGFSEVLAEVPRRRYDPGVLLAQMMVALADGAECVSDLVINSPTETRSDSRRSEGELVDPERGTQQTRPCRLD